MVQNNGIIVILLQQNLTQYTKEIQYTDHLT